jgi:hypothetical protein
LVARFWRVGVFGSEEEVTFVMNTMDALLRDALPESFLQVPKSDVSGTLLHAYNVDLARYLMECRISRRMPWSAFRRRYEEVFE